MLELKEGLSEWKSLPTLLSIEDSASSSIGCVNIPPLEHSFTSTTVFPYFADRRRANRSSVADLAKLYATQISTLHTTIEGSSKFVPAIPGRHIKLEIENSWSLNAATYKVEYAVHFVLLDDLLLVAKRRKRRTGEGGKLVAEKCWPINEISLLDMKDSQGVLLFNCHLPFDAECYVDVSRAFRFRRGKESFVYRCDKSSDKKALFGSFKTTAEELAARKRKEREVEHERRRSLWAAGDVSTVLL
jgi:exocyst complex component 8